MNRRSRVQELQPLFSKDTDRNRASLRALESLTFDTIADGPAAVTRNAKEKLARLPALQQ